VDFYELLGVFDQVGGFDILLPFLLVFTLVFAVLQKISLFGSGKKNINMIVALIISIFFLNNTYLIFIMQKFLPNVSIILVVVLMFLLIFGTFIGPNKFKEGMLGWAFIVSLIAVVFALFSDVFDPYAGPETGITGWYYAIDPGTRFMVWLLLIAVIFVIFVMGGDNSKKNFVEKIGDWIERN
jgi:hypothetical protein